MKKDEEEDIGGDGGEETSPSSVPLFSEIFATDIDECLPGLEANAVKNAPSATSVEVVRWEEEGEGEEGEEGGGEGEEGPKLLNSSTSTGASSREQPRSSKPPLTSSSSQTPSTSRS